MARERKILISVLALIMSIALVFGIFGAIVPFGNIINVAEADDGGVEFPQPRADEQFDLSVMSHLHWVLSGFDSDLRSGKVYSYSYKDENNDPQTYYTMAKVANAPEEEWKEWTYVGETDVYSSIVRYRTSPTFNHQIELFSDTPDAFNVVGGYIQDGQFTNRADAIGRYVASVVIEAQDGYEFVKSNLATGSTLTQRGMSINIDNDGKRATIEKVWYVVAYENSLLDGGLSVETSQEQEFEIHSWKFGEGQNVSYPWLKHGDALLNENNVQDPDYTLKVDGVEITENVDGVIKLKDDWNPANETATNDILHFTLIRNGNEIIAENLPRSRWNHFINEYMPVGNYTLTIDVSTITLGAHYHWWDHGDKHDTVNGMSIDYIGFTRTFNFNVTPGTMTMHDASVNQNGMDARVTAMHEVDVKNLEMHDYSSMFTPANAITFDGLVNYQDVVNYGGFWGESAQKHLYDTKPTLMFNFYRMNDKMGVTGNIYLEATSGEWAQYFEGPSDYTVFYLAQMKNYDTNPVVGDERYEHYFYVKVYQVVATPTLSQTSVPYSGTEIIVGPSTADTKLFKWSDNRKTNVGKYQAKFEFYSTGNYKWSGEKPTGGAYDFGDAFYIDWEITPYVVNDVTIAERYFTDNTITPTIPRPRNQSNGEYIYTIQHPDGFTKGEYKDAGTYTITLTLASNNYMWESDRNLPEAERKLAHTVDFVINPLVNSWEINPSIRHWQWGYFDRETIRVEGTPSKGAVMFTVYTDEACLTPAPGLQDFVVVDGMIREIREEAFKALPAGNYWLQAKVESSRNYTGLTSQAVPFNVGEARNFWKDNLNIIRWTYGSFDKAVNVITAQPTFGTSVWIGVYKVNGDREEAVAGLENISIDANGVIQGAAADLFAKLSAGTYRLKASAVREPAGYIGDDETKPFYNYSELEGSIDFVIQMATNFWVQTPNIPRWIIGEVINEPTGEPKYGKVNYTITDGNNNEIYNTKTGLNNLATALPGWHTLTATVDSDGVNYTGLTSSVRFRVFGTEVNFWLTVPNIQGWTEGEDANMPVASAAFGNVTYTYKTADGTILTEAPTAAGDYILVATAKDDYFEDITAEVRFTIKAKPVVVEQSNTGFIAAIAVLAVLAAVAIVATVVLVIINKKKSQPVHARPFNDDRRSDI